MFSNPTDKHCSIPGLFSSPTFYTHCFKPGADTIERVGSSGVDRAPDESIKSLRDCSEVTESDVACEPKNLFRLKSVQVFFPLVLNRILSSE